MNIPEYTAAMIQEAEKLILGKRDRIRLILMALLAEGHILLDDLPGVGKTTLVKALAIASGCEAKRVQFVPDLLPADIIGMNIFDQKTGQFRRLDGPVFTNILLADEINRAVPRTQSALLEAMEEKSVTIDGEQVHSYISPAHQAGQTQANKNQTYQTYDNHEGGLPCTKAQG